MHLHCQGSRFISINYHHSRCIQHNTIDIELKSENNDVKNYYMKVSTKNIDKMIKIEKEYFDYLFEKILSLNYQDILLSNINIVSTGAPFLERHISQEIFQ